VIDNRVKIPVFALLTLSMTDCVERSPGSDADPIIGDWHAVKIDADMFPMVQSEGPYMTELGVKLHVGSDLQGTLLQAIESEYDGYVGGYEQGSTLIVDASAAPKYRIDVRHALFGPEPYEETYGPATTIGGYDTGGYDTGYVPDTDTDGYTDTDTGGALAGPGSSRPLRIPESPRRAPAEMILRCTIDEDYLNCERDGDEDPKLLVFERTKDDDAG